MAYYFPDVYHCRYSFKRIAYFGSKFTVFICVYSLRIYMLFLDWQFGCIKRFSGRFLLCPTYYLVYVLLLCRDFSFKPCLLFLTHLLRKQIQLKLIRIKRKVFLAHTAKNFLTEPRKLAFKAAYQVLQTFIFLL